MSGGVLTDDSTSSSRSEHRFYVASAITALVLVVTGFGPALSDPATRRAPLTVLVRAHGIVTFAWLVLYFIQTVLIATGRVRLHRRLGITAAPGSQPLRDLASPGAHGISPDADSGKWADLSTALSF